MSKFFVGCPVRLVRPVKPKNMGWEGHITYFRVYPKGTVCDNGSILSFDCDCLVQWHTGSTRLNTCATWQLEPIVPEGMKPTTWEKCLWQPEKSLVTV